jgi:hypothetical protein
MKTLLKFYRRRSIRAQSRARSPQPSRNLGKKANPTPAPIGKYMPAKPPPSTFFVLNYRFC